MDWDTGIEVIIAVLAIGSVVPYVIDTLAGRTKPQRVSLAVFAALASAATAAQLSQHGVTSGAILTAMSAVGCAAVAIASIKHGVGGTSLTDRVVLGGLGLTLAVWALLGNHPVVLPLLIAIEIPAIAATVVKVVRLPGTETSSTWLAEGSASLLAVAMSTGFDPSIMYPMYNFAVNFAVLAAIWWSSPTRRTRSFMTALPTLSPARVPTTLNARCLVPFGTPIDAIEWARSESWTDVAALADEAAWADAAAVAKAAAASIAEPRSASGHLARI